MSQVFELIIAKLQKTFKKHAHSAVHTVHNIKNTKEIKYV